MEYLPYMPYSNINSNYVSSYENSSHQPNLENIVSSHTDKPEKDFIKRILSDKSRTLKSTVKALLAEIDLRKRVSNDVVSRMDYDICKCCTYLQEIKFFTQRSYVPDTSFTSRRTQLEDRIFSIENEKRREEVFCWRDLMFLRKYLMGALKDYWLASGTEELMSSDMANLLDKNEHTDKGS